MNLPCSHIFCSCCLEGLISTQSKTCPVCRESFTATAAKDLMNNRIVLNMAKQFSSINLGAKNTSRSPKMSSRGTDGSLRKVIKDFKKKVSKKAIDDLQDTEYQILGVLEIFDEMEARVVSTNKAIEEVKPLITNHLTSIGQHIAMWKSNLAVVRREKEKVQDLECKLDNCGRVSSAGVVMGDIEDALQDSQEEIRGFGKLLERNEGERHDSEKEFLNTEARLKEILEEAAETLVPSQQDAVIGNELYSFSDALTGNLQKEVYVVKLYQGRMRLAPVRKSSNNLCFVSRLLEGYLPRNCSMIEVDSLITRTFRMAFLDLGVDGTLLGRIIIKVMDEGNWPLYFLHLCAGDLGPSYVDSCTSKGETDDVFYFGPCTLEGKAEMPGIDWEAESTREIYNFQSLNAGRVVGLYSADGPSLFCITTRNISMDRFWSDIDIWPHTFRCIGLFGVLEEGLDVLTGIISRKEDTTRIKITDCGLVISP